MLGNVPFHVTLPSCHFEMHAKACSHVCHLSKQFRVSVHDTEEGMHDTEEGMQPSMLMLQAVPTLHAKADLTFRILLMLPRKASSGSCGSLHVNILFDWNCILVFTLINHFYLLFFILTNHVNVLFFTLVNCCCHLFFHPCS